MSSRKQVRQFKSNSAGGGRDDIEDLERETRSRAGGGGPVPLGKRTKTELKSVLAAPQAKHIFYVRHCRWPTIDDLPLKEQSRPIKLTPLETQVLQFRLQVPPSVILFIACGYKMRLFGRDSVVASRRLGIMCVPGDPFESSSVPLQRVGYHAERLVGMGYTVGIVDQESAALRQEGTGKSGGGVFERTLRPLVSKGTLINSLVSPTSSSSKSTTAGGGGEGGEDDENDEDQSHQPQDGDSQQNFDASVEGERYILCLTEEEEEPLSTTEPALGVLGIGGQRKTLLSVAVVSFVKDTAVYVTHRSIPVDATTDKQRQALQAIIAAVLPVEVVVTDSEKYKLRHETLGVLRSVVRLNEGPSVDGAEAEDGNKTVPLTVVPSSDFVFEGGAVPAGVQPEQHSGRSTGIDLKAAPSYRLLLAFAEPRDLHKTITASFAVHPLSALIQLGDHSHSQPREMAGQQPGEQRHEGGAGDGTCMFVSGHTLRHLDVLEDAGEALPMAASFLATGTSSSSAGGHSSLIWLLNHCKTAFGYRLLKSWVLKPSVSLQVIEDRLDAVEYLLGQKDGHRPSAGGSRQSSKSKGKNEAVTSSASSSFSFRSLFVGGAAPGGGSSVKDLESIYNRLRMGRCTPPDYVSFLGSLLRISATASAIAKSSSKSNDPEAGRAKPSPPPPPPPLLTRALDRIANDELTEQTRQLLMQVHQDATEPWQLYVTKDFATVAPCVSATNPRSSTSNKNQNVCSAAQQESLSAIAALVAQRQRTESQLQEWLAKAQTTLKLPMLQYKTVAAVTYLLELPSASEKKAPASWSVVSRTKAATRFQSPEVQELVQQLAANGERIRLAGAEAWSTQQFIEWSVVGSHGISTAEQQRHRGGGEEKEEGHRAPATGTAIVGGQHNLFSQAIDALAQVDALLSLSSLGDQPGYCRPTFLPLTSKRRLCLKGLRHPMQAALMSTTSYVANNVEIGIANKSDLSGERVDGDDGYDGDGEKIDGGVWILTGPNMGGKSALMRSIALCVLMAQIGSFVPCEVSAELPIYHALYTRMGAEDDLLEGRSTFLSEMRDTADILRSNQLDRSLVLMDEVGRGTSSFDGVAVAESVLAALVRSRCTAVFITHYPTVCHRWWAARSSTPYPSDYHLQQNEKGEEKEIKREREVGGGLTAAATRSEHQMIEKYRTKVQCKYMSFALLAAAPTSGTGTSTSTCSTGTTSARAVQEEGTDDADIIAVGGNDPDAIPQQLVFLYKATDGVTPSSFGLNIAQSANIPSNVLSTASHRSRELEQEANRRLQLGALRNFILSTANR